MRHGECPNESKKEETTMTIQSFTDPNKTYETTLESCQCGDFQFRQAKVGGKCKHQQALIIHLANRDTIFGLLKAKYDVRENGQEESRRCYYEMQMASGF